MNQLLEWLSQLFGSWKFWIVVPPWDVGVRVRLGKNATALPPGPHWRLPFLDEVTLVNTRLRINSAPPVTIEVEGQESRTVRAIVGYRVSNPLLALMNFDPPHQAVQGYAQANVGPDTTPEQNLHALRSIFHDKGVTIEFLNYVEDVKVQTIRLLQDSWGIATYSEIGEGRY